MLRKKLLYQLLKTILLFCFLSGYNTIHAQECTWLEVGGGVTYENPQASAIDKNNNIIVGGRFLDSFSVGSHFIPQSTNGGFNTSFLIKYDSSGAILWTTTIQHTQIRSNSYCSIQKITTDADNNIHVVGDFVGKLDFGNGVTITDTLYNCFLVKYNSNGVAQWALGSTINTRTPIFSLQTDNANNVYLGFNFDSATAFQGSLATLSTTINKFDIGIAKFSSSGDFINAIQFGDPLVNEDFLDLGIDSSNNVYLLGYSTTNLSFGAQQLNGKGQLILKLDSALKPIKGVKTDLHYLSAGQLLVNFNAGTIAVNADGKFAVSSKLYDSVYYGNSIWLKTQWPHPPPNSNIVTLAIVFYDSAITPLWAHRNDTLSPPAYPEIVEAKIMIKNDFIYAYGRTSGNTRFNGKKLLNAGQYLLKLDFYGNALMGITQPNYSSAYIVSAQVDYYGDIYFVGVFQNYASILNKTKNGFGSSDFFVAKIDDIDITRNYVKSGPYCAGDTIKIPFTKNGKFNNGNQFIAELSDSAGNFYGDEIELGRIADTAAGTINGILPLFNVSTANKYRIRITSTDPWAQSYYKRDTLRLLIYSKDTANAGADQTVCQGKPIRLGTTGGSRWAWSPTNYFLNPADSTNRQPLIKLYDSVEFRIIISDSSGCGDVDTDYVKIYVRPNPKTTIVGDSVVCLGYRQTLQAQTTGGDSTHYWYIWKTVGFNIVINTTASLTIRPATTTQYMVITGDSCSSKIDTAYFTVNVKNNLKAIATIDTAICTGNTITLAVTGIGCNPSKYTYEWFKFGSPNAISNNDSINVSPTTTTQYSVILKDTSTFLTDTAHIIVTVYQPLQLTLNPDSTICLGQTAQLRATTTGGNPNTRNIQWIANHQPLSTSNTLTVSPATTTTYKALLSDGCSAQNDSTTITITVRPKLQLTLNPDSTICLGQTTQIRAISTGGYTPQHQLQWTANNQQLSTSNTLTVSPSTTTIYQALLSDNCTTPSDSATITITVRPPLKVSITPDTTICTGQTLTLTATPTGGYTPQHQLQWTANNQQLSTSNTLTVSPSTTTIYQALLSDNCTTPNDSTQTTITVRPPLTLKAIAKDSICANQILQLTATPSGGNIPAHQIQWNTNNSTWTSNQNPATDTPKINTKYIATLSDNCSPTVYDTIEVKVLPVPQADFTFNPTQGCPPLTVTLTDNSIGNDTNQNIWTIGNTEYQNKTKIEHQLTQTGTYNLQLNIKNQLGCVDQTTYHNAITVYPKPKAAFIVKPDIKEIEEPLTLINQSSTNTVIWDMGDRTQLTPSPTGNGDTTYTYQDTGWLTLQIIAQNNLGCYDTARQQILLYDKVHCSIPSAFTPNNNDNHNPVFAPVCVGVANYILTIYNRWGQIIFSQENGVWDGTYSGESVPSDIYLYKIQIQADSKKKKLTYGTVQVIR